MLVKLWGLFSWMRDPIGTAERDCRWCFWSRDASPLYPIFSVPCVSHATLFVGNWWHQRIPIWMFWWHKDKVVCRWSTELIHCVVFIDVQYNSCRQTNKADASGRNMRKMKNGVCWCGAHYGLCNRLWSPGITDGNENWDNYFQPSSDRVMESWGQRELTFVLGALWCEYIEGCWWNKGPRLIVLMESWGQREPMLVLGTLCCEYLVGC